MKKIEVKIFADGLIDLPKYETEFSAGMDVRAFTPGGPHTIFPDEIAIVPTGMKVAIPDGFEIQIRSRSGLAAKHGVSVINAPGTIDSDYRGYIGVILKNGGNESFIINHGDRIAQLVLAPVYQIFWDVVDEPSQLGETARGEGGFGHTGK